MASCRSLLYSFKLSSDTNLSTTMLYPSQGSPLSPEEDHSIVDERLASNDMKIFGWNSRNYTTKR